MFRSSLQLVRKSLANLTVRMMRFKALLVTLALVLSLCRAVVLEYDYHNFPKDVVALHMPCEESNMFATKCMCHLKCTDTSCNSAKALCAKYEKRWVFVSLCIYALLLLLISTFNDLQ
jgi:hypothetical protein